MTNESPKETEKKRKENFKKQMERELERRVVEKGRTPEEKKQKAEWFKKHVIIDMG